MFQLLSHSYESFGVIFSMKFRFKYYLFLSHNVRHQWSILPSCLLIHIHKYFSIVEIVSQNLNYYHSLFPQKQSARTQPSSCNNPTPTKVKHQSKTNPPIYPNQQEILKNQARLSKTIRQYQQGIVTRGS